MCARKRSAFSRSSLDHTNASANYISGTFRDPNHPRAGLGFGYHLSSPIVQRLAVPVNAWLHIHHTHLLASIRLMIRLKRGRTGESCLIGWRCSVIREQGTEEEGKQYI